MVHTNFKGRVDAVVAGTAVLAALGGVGGAAAAGKIGSLQIRDHSIRAVDYNKGSVNSRAITDGGIQRVDLDPTLRSLLGVAGLKGVTGAAGATGATGATGADGVTGYQQRSATVSVSGNNGTASASCGQGEVVLGGGVAGGNITLRSSYPSASDTWTVVVDKTNGVGNISLTVYAVCATVNMPN